MIMLFVLFLFLVEKPDNKPGNILNNQTNEHQNQSKAQCLRA